MDKPIRLLDIGARLANCTTHILLACFVLDYVQLNDLWVLWTKWILWSSAAFAAVWFVILVLGGILRLAGEDI